MAAKSPYERSKPKSGLKYPYDFSTETLFNLENPGTKDEKRTALKKEEWHKITNYKKNIHGEYGLRYLPKWMIRSMKAGKAYFVDGEAALFSNLK